jgi:hypothetical protein
MAEDASPVPTLLKGPQKQIRDIGKWHGSLSESSFSQSVATQECALASRKAPFSCIHQQELRIYIGCNFNIVSHMRDCL